MKPEYRLKSRIWCVLFICSLLVCPELKPETTKRNHRNETSESTKTTKTKTKTKTWKRRANQAKSFRGFRLFRSFFITTLSQKYFRNMRTIGVTNSLHCHETVAVIGSCENEALENEDRSTKHPEFENEAPKSRKRSTQISKTKHPRSKTKHPKLENEAP